MTSTVTPVGRAPSSGGSVSVAFARFRVFSVNYFCRFGLAVIAPHQEKLGGQNERRPLEPEHLRKPS